jgi:hypothetical protein
MCDDLVAQSINATEFSTGGSFGRGRSTNPFSEYVCMYLPHSHRETLSAAKTVAVLASTSPHRGALRAFGGHLF